MQKKGEGWGEWRQKKSYEIKVGAGSNFNNEKVEMLLLMLLL